MRQSSFTLKLYNKPLFITTKILTHLTFKQKLCKIFLYNFYKILRDFLLCRRDAQKKKRTLCILRPLIDRKNDVRATARTASPKKAVKIWQARRARRAERTVKGLL
jgi:hypothetical protein